MVTVHTVIDVGNNGHVPHLGGELHDRPDLIGCKVHLRKYTDIDTHW